MRPIAWAMALLAGLVVGAHPALARPARTVTVQILAINDLHGNLEPPWGAEGLVNKIPAGGVEYLATHLAMARRDNPNTILVGGGDLMGASPLMAGLFDQKPTIEAVNAMHMTVTAIGNHELDDGQAVFLKRARAAHFRYLAANVRRTGGGPPLEPATAVLTVGGVRIGFIGEVLHETRDMVAPSASAGLDFLEESAVANAAAARLRRQGVRAIVLLIHQGGRQKPGDGAPFDPDGCDGFRGDITGILPKLSPAIRVVVSGHSHQFYNCLIGGRRVTSAGAFGQGYSAISLTIDRRSDRIEAVSAHNRVVTRDVAKDPVQTAILEKYRPGTARVARRIVGSVTEEISRNTNAASESALGDVIADAYLASAAAPERGGAEVGLANSGGIRAVISGAPGADGRRAVSYGEVYAAQPFGDRMNVITLTGEMIRRLLEQQFHPTGRPEILQVSKGFSYRYRLEAPLGQHVEAGSISLNGRPIAPDQMVRVVTSDFLVQGGSGLSILTEGGAKRLDTVDVDAVAQYLEAHSPVAPGPRDRIVRTDAPAP